MSLIYRDLVLQLQQEEAELPQLLAKQLSLPVAELHNVRILRRAIDARKKPRVRRVYTLAFEHQAEPGLQQRFPQLLPLEPSPEPPRLKVAHPLHVLVVGMGPAGLFAALQLARSGVQVTLIERGEPIEDRVKAVRDFWQRGVLQPESNVQFGEGGAGTFSDGKLTTRVNHPWNRFVLETLVACGAPAEILIEARPHVGTDRLRATLIRFRQQLGQLGVTISFRTRLSDLLCRDGRVVGVRLNDERELAVDAVVLAPGHSARDTYQLLQERGVSLEAKPFAVGFRIEHPVELINQIQYGYPNHPKLPVADYKLAWNNPRNQRGVYSFCMCPGGEVVNSSSEPGGLVVNGMSSYHRDLERSNSALVVAVRPEDFPDAGVLAGVRFQRQLEQQAFVAGGGDYHAPAQNLMAFLRRGQGPLVSSCAPGVREADLRALLPEQLVGELLQALPKFEQRMPGFITREAVLVGVESRTSAPVRILRGSDGQSLSLSNLYPAGEGAGYAGGIMSAALDGLRAAEQLIHNQG